ncbi:MAG: substrate-binding domain-containing protein [Geminicoccaceae bacterium]
MMARHLVELGHRSIAVISGITADNDRTTGRLAGIRTELSRHGIELSGPMVEECPYTITDGRNACARLLSRTGTPPTALICGNDILALGALIECRSEGLEIPGDISIAGFDNLEISRHSNPPLTTIDVPAEEMGRAVADHLLKMLGGESATIHESVSVQLIARGSCGPPRKSPDADGRNI